MIRWRNGIVGWWRVSGSSTLSAHISFERRFTMLAHFEALDRDDD